MTLILAVISFISMHQTPSKTISLPDGERITIEIWHEDSLEIIGPWETMILKVFPSFNHLGRINKQGFIWERVSDSGLGILYKSESDYQRSRGSGMGMVFAGVTVEDPLIFFWDLSLKQTDTLLSQKNKKFLSSDGLSYEVYVLDDGRVLEYDADLSNATLFYDKADYQRYSEILYGAEYNFIQILIESGE